MAAPINQPKPHCGSEEAQGGWAGDESVTSGGFSSQASELAEEDAEAPD